MKKSTKKKRGRPVGTGGPRTKIIVGRVTPENHAAVKELSERQSRSMSYIVNDALELYFMVQRNR